MLTYPATAWFARMVLKSGDARSFSTVRPFSSRKVVKAALLGANTSR